MFEGHIMRLAQCRPGKCEILDTNLDSKFMLNKCEWLDHIELTY